MAHVPAPKPQRSPVAGLRHEILTPLNHIIGFSEMLLDDLEEPGYSSLYQNLKRIRETGREMVRTVERILVAKAARRLDLALATLREELNAPIHSILQTVGAITSEDGSNPAIENTIDDVLAIGRAAAELLEFAQGHRSFIPADSHAPSAPIHGPSSEPGRVLVVDDNNTSRDLSCRYLRRAGHSVTGVASGAEALAVMLQSAQDVVLLDMLMPKLNGFQVLERIKRDPSLNQVPVIVISALNEVQSVVRCLEIGAEDYLFKPVDPVLLEARVRSCLEKKRLLDRERRKSADLEIALQKLRANDQRLRLTLSADRGSIWDWDPAAGRITIVRHLGSPEPRHAEWTLEQALARVHPQDRERLRTGFLQAAEERRDFREQYRVLSKLGKETWFESMGTPDYAPNGAFRGMTGVSREIPKHAAAIHEFQKPVRKITADLNALLRRARPDDQRVLRGALESLADFSKLLGDFPELAHPAPTRRKPPPSPK